MRNPANFVRNPEPCLIRHNSLSASITFSIRPGTTLPSLLLGEIQHALRDQFDLSEKDIQRIRHTPCDESLKPNIINDLQIGHTVCDQFNPGRFTPNLSWSHYRFLLKVKSPEARAFY